MFSFFFFSRSFIIFFYDAAIELLAKKAYPSKIVFLSLTSLSQFKSIIFSQQTKQKRKKNDEDDVCINNMFKYWQKRQFTFNFQI